jgi:uncharacterized protein (DUF697 family)
MNEEQRIRCHAVIHSASTAAAAVGAGLAQIPVADNAVIVPIQVTMVVALGNIFNQHVTDSVANGMILGSAASLVGRTISQFFVCWIPVVGNAINATTAAIITEAIGWSIADKFDKDGIINTN